MNKALFTGLLTLLTLLPLASAQEAAPAAGFSVAFVRSEELLAAHPAGQAASELTEQARTELEGISQSVQPLLEKRNTGEQLTAEEQNTLELSQRTLQETQERYQQEIEAAAQPATEAINAIIQQVAQEEGYSLVMNYAVANTSGLVVYADTAKVPDITQAVIDRIGAGGGGN